MLVGLVENLSYISHLSPLIPAKISELPLIRISTTQSNYIKMLVYSMHGGAFILLALFLNLIFPNCRASPVAAFSSHKHAATPIPATPFFYFPNSNQAENIRPRVNGQILITLNTAPELYQIDPFQNQTGGIVHSFEGYTSLFGIVELQTDIFYIIASNYTSAPDYFGFKGSVSILEVDLRGVPNPVITQGEIKVSKIVDIPQAQLLDGFAVVNKTAGLLISGDAQTGTLYLINVHNRTATAVLQNALLAGTSNARDAGLAHIGINGIKVFNGNMYFTNTAQGSFGQVPLDIETGQPVGSPSVLANYSTLTDDLSFDVHGNAFISEPLNGVLLRPANTTPTNNHTRLLAGLFGANSNAFGRTVLDQCILYSTFDGTTSGVARIDLAKAGVCDG